MLSHHRRLWCNVEAASCCVASCREADDAKLLPLRPCLHHRQRAAEKDIDDFECTLCLKLLFEPVTTPCGHTFCKQCFSRTMDHGNKCPMCRTVSDRCSHSRVGVEYSNDALSGLSAIDNHNRIKLDDLGGVLDMTRA